MSGKTYYWWDSINRRRNLESITWETFGKVFYERFFNETTKVNMLVEFMNLKQDNMIVTQYENRFNQLSMFVENIVVRGSNKSCKIFDGLMGRYPYATNVLRKIPMKDFMNS